MVHQPGGCLRSERPGVRARECMRIDGEHGWSPVESNREINWKEPGTTIRHVKAFRRVQRMDAFGQKYP